MNLNLMKIATFLIVFSFLPSCMKRHASDPDTNFKPYYKPVPDDFKKGNLNKARKLDPNEMPRDIKFNGAVIINKNFRSLSKNSDEKRAFKSSRLRL